MDEAVTGQQSGLFARLGSAPPASGEPPHSPATAASHRRQDALIVLAAARGVVQRGWTQSSWYVTKTPNGRRRKVQAVFPSRLDRTQIVEACLVGAVMQAAWQQSPQPEHAYPALDALWHTLLGGGDTVGPLCSPPVRLARVRDLTSWNDHRYRTKDEVLQLLDRTLDRVSLR